MLEIQQYQWATAGEAPILVVDGDDVIAHVYRPEYAPVFCAAPQMLDLLESLSESLSDASMVPAFREAIDEVRLVLLGVRQQQSELEATNDATVTIMDGVDLIAYLQQPTYAPVLAAGFKMLELLQQLSTAATKPSDPVTSRVMDQARDLELAIRVQQSSVAHTRGVTIH
ncbi:MAG: hypothetical protein ABW034_05575 [Steroidobacteraceae bacterium]